MINYANRGMALEEMIGYSNDIYLKKKICDVRKRPVPIKILERRGSKVVGYLESAGTLDYEGVYRGRSIQFEAKSTMEKTRFPLDNFHEHQIEHMRSCIFHGAITFAIIEFSSLNERYLVSGKGLVLVWDNWKKGGKASIPYKIVSKSEPVLSSFVPVDYVNVIDKLIFKK